MLDSYNDVLTVKEVGAILHIGKNSVYELLQQGEIKSIKHGRRYIIPKLFLIDYINKYR